MNVTERGQRLPVRTRERPADEAARSEQELTTPHAILGAIILVGIVLRVGQWASRQSYFVDESALLLSVFARPLHVLIREPLLFAQSAPPGFVALERLMFLAAGPGELGARFLPLLAGIATLPLMAVLALRLLPALEATVVTALLSFSVVHIHHSADAKPYAFDVLGALIVLLLTERLLRNPVGACRMAIAVPSGFLLILFSQPVALVLAAASVALVCAPWLRPEGGRSRPARVVAIAWLTAALLSAGLARQRMTAEGLEYMRLFWQSGFPPLPPTSVREALWLPLALGRFSFEGLGSILPGALVLPMLLGIMWLARRDRIALAVGAAPVGIALVASALRQYPFGAPGLPLGAHGSRVLLFLVPSALVLVGGGLVWFRMALVRHSPRAAILVCSAVIALTLIRLTITFPSDEQQIRSVLEEVHRRRSPGDLMYVYYGAQHGFELYAPTLGLADAPALYGVCSRAHPAGYLADLSRLRGARRVWLVYANPFLAEVRLLESAFDGMGARQVNIEERRAGAILYELSGSSETRPTIPPTFLRPPPDPWPTIGCRGIHQGIPSGYRAPGATWVRNPGAPPLRENRT